MDLSDKQRSKAERVSHELEQLRTDIRQVDAELARMGPHDPKHPMKTSWGSGGVLQGTSGTVGQVLHGASPPTLELINAYANSYTSADPSMLVGLSAADAVAPEADVAMLTISPSTGALSLGGHAPEMISGLAPEHRFTQRGIHGGSTADFQASFLSAATPRFAPVGEAKITDWWFYSPEEAKAAHPVLRVSSERSIGPRREWDPSCVEVLPGDLEDQDTPRGSVGQQRFL